MMALYAQFVRFFLTFHQMEFFMDTIFWQGRCGFLGGKIKKQQQANAEDDKYSIEYANFCHESFYKKLRLV